MNIELIERDYRRWAKCRTEWYSFEEFINSKYISDGVHTIQLGKTTFELFSSGHPFNNNQYENIPVFFSGAVSRRDKLIPPFFSGLSLGKDLGVPFIAISDPLVDQHSQIGLAWYTGSVDHWFQGLLAKFFQQLNIKKHKKFFFVGGSGGGFAALYQSPRNPTISSCLTWNPQTSIFKYWENHVKKYLRYAGIPGSILEKKNWIEDTRNWTSRKIAFDLQSPDKIFRNNKLLYLQNKSDWHVQEHLEPWLGNKEWTAQGAKGPKIFAHDSMHIIVQADFAEGHAPVPTPTILNALRSLIVDNNSVDQTVNKLLDQK
ncbi:hypothetical protein VVR12_08265 [Rothia sp. LK2588]|uniref:hypothetical protein n=1 Tax=Rothia sp. LK2588 TaxID=3114369 RepID=UPI0034CD8621